MELVDKNMVQYPLSQYLQTKAIKSHTLGFPDGEEITDVWLKLGDVFEGILPPPCLHHQLHLIQDHLTELIVWFRLYVCTSIRACAMAVSKTTMHLGSDAVIKLFSSA